MKRQRLVTLLEALALLVVLQALKLTFEYFICPILPDTDFTRRMVTAGVMLVLTAAVCAYAQLRKTPLSVFPKRFGTGYIIFTCIAAALLISSPSNFSGGIQPIALAIYGSIVTPVYEELVFRGFLWNRLERVFSNSLIVFLLSIALFTVWHLGYMTTQLLDGNWSAVLWKLAAGVGYGAVLGFVRLKAKNCYATILVHGVLNIFMI